MRERGATPGSRNAIDFARVCLDRCNDPKTLVKVITDVPTYNLKFDEPQFVFVLNKLSADGANARYVRFSVCIFLIDLFCEQLPWWWSCSAAMLCCMLPALCIPSLGFFPVGAFLLVLSCWCFPVSAFLLVLF